MKLLFIFICVVGATAFTGCKDRIIHTPTKTDSTTCGNDGQPSDTWPQNVKGTFTYDATNGTISAPGLYRVGGPNPDYEIPNIFKPAVYDPTNSTISE